MVHKEFKNLNQSGRMLNEILKSSEESTQIYPEVVVRKNYR